MTERLKHRQTANLLESFQMTTKSTTIPAHAAVNGHLLVTHQSERGSFHTRSVLSLHARADRVWGVAPDESLRQQMTSPDATGGNSPGRQSSTDTLDDAALTAFQRDILVVLADDPQYGLGIKGRLEELYQEEVNHGRLYPNLDDLIENGYLTKSELDKRTNEYALTEWGRDAVNGRLQFLLDELNKPFRGVDESDDAIQNRGGE